MSNIIRNESLDTNVTSGMLRARDVRDRLKGRVDPEVSKCLETLAEQQRHLWKSMTEVVAMVDQMSSITANFVQVAENMKKVVDANKPPEDGQGGLTQ